MKKLIERLEMAKVPSRELDCLIWAELNGRDVRRDEPKMLAKSRRAPHDECWIGSWMVNGNFHVHGNKPPIPEYTSSLDAALTLVPEKRYVFAIHQTPAGWSVKVADKIDDRQSFEADELPSPALAICVAAINSRAALIRRIVG